MSFEPRIFEGTWREALNHAEEISQNQNVLIFAMEQEPDNEHIRYFQSMLQALVVQANVLSKIAEPTTIPANSGNEASIALLRKWRASAPTDPQAIQEAEQDLQEFMDNINAERKRAGTRLVYPEV